MKNNTLTLGSLFDGSGGFPLGGVLAGITPLWASEIEPFAIRVTTKRFPHMKHYGNITSMDGGKIEPVDIITFGSPCQDMSVAGKRDGLGGSRSNLFFEAIRIIKERTSRQSSKRSSASSGKTPRCLFLKAEGGLMPTCTWETDGALRTELSMLNTGESPNVAVESTLSQILQVGVPATYYLSPRACQGILRRASVRGKELPTVLQTALVRQASVLTDTTAQ